MVGRQQRIDILWRGKICTSTRPCLPPTVLVANNDKEKADVVRLFGDLINRECNDGWEYYSLETIAVAVKPGCLGVLTGAKQTETLFNMLVFRKQQ